MKKQLLCALASSLVISNSISAATFMVVNTNALGAGSLQQAIFDANTNAGVDTIAFNIPSGGLTISPTNALPVIVEPVTIDGSTQPGFVSTPIIELNGISAGATVDGLKIATSNCVIRALVINRFLGDGIEITNGANNTIAGCYIGLNLAGLTDLGNTLNGILLTNAPNNTIGGLTASDRNYISGNNQSGVHLGGALTTNNFLLGNYIGLNVANAAIVNSADGIRANAPFNIIGGGASGARNVISGNTGQGIEITALGTGTVVRGNYIGTDGTGTLDRGNSIDGLLVSAAGVIVGGVNAGEGNLISGNNGDGIEFNGLSATNNLVQGNIIGATASGTAVLLNSGNGILITTSSHDNIIGGVLAGQANVIAFNTGSGINVVAATANTNNTFRGNSIFSNGSLGIDLGAAGATLNDANDADTGANQLQNFPALSSAISNSPTEVILTGSLGSMANTTYAVDFYANASFDASGHGEGQFYLGSRNLTTDGTGQANFTQTFTAPLPGRYLAATATDPNGNTSEFSRWVVIGGPLATNLSGGADFVFIVDATTSMSAEIAAVKSGLRSFVAGLDTAAVDARFAVVLFGGAPEVVLDFTTDQAVTEASFDLINVNSAVAGVQNNHNVNPEAGLEAIRIVLNAATNNTLLRNNVGGTGPLVFRPDARKNLIVVTDENSDLPFYAENREAGQTGTEPPSPLTAPWQAEIDNTAQAVIANNAFVNLLITPSGVIRNQYGDPAQSVSDANFLNFNPTATLANLTNTGFGSSLEAQVLAAGLIGRTFNIASVNTTNFIANFFAAKVEEIVNNTPPPPRLNIVSLPPNAVRVTWTTNSFGYLLETNQMWSLNGWGVLTTNYSIIGTNYAVTNSTGDAMRLYRLRK